MVKTTKTPLPGAPLGNGDVYRQLVDATPALLWMTDADNHTTYFNNTWLTYTGRPLEEEVGDGWRNAIHDDDRDAAFEAFYRAASARSPFVMDYRLRRHDGEYRWLRDTGVPRFTTDGSFDGYVGSCIDITDHKQTESALKESERFARATVDALSAHIAIIDEDGVIIAVNKAWRDFASANQPIRSNVFEGANYLHVCERTTGPDAADARAFAQGIRAVLRGETSEFALEYPCHAPFEQRWFNARVTRFEDAGPVRVVISHENITTRKLLEESTNAQNEIIETVNRIGQALSAELDLEKLLQRITHAAAEVTHAQAGVFFYRMVDDAESDAQYATVATLPTEGERFAVLRETPLLDAILESATVVRSDYLRRDSRFTDMLAAHPFDLPVTSLLAVPVRSRDGALAGGLFLVHSRSSMFGEREEQLAVGLASQASIALDNARLFSTERDARRKAELATARVTQLQAITAELSEAVTPQQVAEVIVTRALDSLGGQLGMVSLLSPDGLWLDVAAMSGATTPEAAGLPRSSVDANHPLNTAVRLGQPLWVESTDGLRQQFAYEAAEALPHGDGPASANLPLIANGRVIGGIGLLFTGERTFSNGDKTFLMSLAQQCAQAVQRAQLFADEHAARHEAERANALKLKFLAMISHELRTPLTSIKGFATTLLADDVTFEPDDQLHFLGIINEEADKLAELVDQLMDLSRLQAGTLGIRPERQTMAGIVNKAMAQLMTLTPEHRLVIDVPEALPRVLADAQRIAQVLVNLVGNAAKYAPSHSDIIIQARSTGDVVRVDVCDSGPGIPAPARAYVFEAFRQVDDSSPWPKKGAGLGLAICKGLVEAHGGSIWIDETSQTGTTIAFTLPTSKSH